MKILIVNKIIKNFEDFFYYYWRATSSIAFACLYIKYISDYFIQKAILQHILLRRTQYDLLAKYLHILTWNRFSGGNNIIRSSRGGITLTCWEHLNSMVRAVICKSNHN